MKVFSRSAHDIRKRAVTSEHQAARPIPRGRGDQWDRVDMVLSFPHGNALSPLQRNEAALGFFLEVYA